MKNLISKLVTLFHKENCSPISKSKIASYLPSNPVVLEAGAHTGADTVEMAKLWKTSTIHAFEPIPNLFHQLQANTKPYPRVKCHNLALGDINGVISMYVSEGESDGSSSILKPKDHIKLHPRVTFDKRIRVKSQTINHFCHKNNINKIDFMWLDMQGYELQTLKQSTNILDSVSVIYTEVNFVETYENVSNAVDLLIFLSHFGFSVALEDLRWKSQGNYLLVKSNKI